MRSIIFLLSFLIAITFPYFKESEGEFLNSLNRTRALRFFFSSRSLFQGVDSEPFGFIGHFNYYH